MQERTSHPEDLPRQTLVRQTLVRQTLVRQTLVRFALPCALCIICVLACRSAACLFAVDPPVQPDRTVRLQQVAKASVELLEQGKWEAVTAEFDATMTRVFPTEKLKEVWTSRPGLNPDANPN